MLAQNFGGQTTFPYLALGVQPNTNSPPNIARMCFERAGVAVSPQEGPQAVFDRLFSSFLGGGPPPTGTAADRKSDLDAVFPEYNALLPKLGTDDRTKLNVPFTLLRDLENRLAHPPPGVTCTAPGRPGSLDLAGGTFRCGCWSRRSRAT